MALFIITVVFWGCHHVINRSEIAIYKATFKPGVKILNSYESTVKKYSCENSTSIYLEGSTFRPIKVVAGEQILNRIVYASCSPQGLPGSIIRKVHCGVDLVFEDKTDFTFMPGTWAVTAYIQVPPHAGPGAYVLEVLLKTKNQVIKETYPFQVLNR